MSSSPYNPKDKLFHKAKEQGYRSRAAFKLLEIHKKTPLFKAGDWVIDLGSSPGSWAQVACGIVGPTGRVYGIDLEEQKSDDSVPPNFVFYQGDVRSAGTLDALHQALHHKKAAAVLSDLAPKLTGIALKDQTDCLELAQAALDIAVRFLKPGGHLVIKVFPGPDLDAFRKGLKPHFKTQKLLQLDATRSTSKEVYILGREFKAAAD